MTRKNLLISILIFGFIFVAQAQQITGNLEGRILDPQGLPLPAVNIVISGPNLQGARGTTTDERGYFRIFALPPGRYSLRISHVAHHDLSIKDVIVELDKTTAIGTIEMTTRTLEAPEVIVYGEQPIIDPVSTTYGGKINSADFQQLPVDRNYRNIAALSPQANTSYFGDETNIGGATGFENKYFVDGIEVTNLWTGASGTNLPYNFIREIEVKTGGYNVDSRSSLGGLINVITHSGSNEFHGSVFGFYTSNQLSENGKLSSVDVTQGDFSDYDMGFSLGGPLIFDKLWFYAAYNPTFNRRDVEVPSFGTYVYKTLTHSFALKLNLMASNNLNIIFTTTGDPTVIDEVGRFVTNPPSTLANPDPYLFRTTLDGVNYSLNGVYTIGKNISLRGLISRVDNNSTRKGSTERGRNEILFEDRVNSIWSGGVGGSGNTFRHSTVGKISATFLLNQHTLNTGIEYKNNSDNHIYDYHRVRRHQDTVYSEYLAKGFGEIQSRIPSAFVQDSWRILDRLRVTAGVRWEGHDIVDPNGEVVQTISVPLQPRVGFVFLPNKNNTQRIFGSFGRFSQEYALQPSEKFNFGHEYTIYFDHDPRVDNTGGDTTINIQRPIGPEEKELRGQYYDEFSLGYERLIGWNIKAGVQGVYRTLREAIEDIYLDEGTRRLYGNPGRGILSEWPRPQRDYAALILTVERSGDEHFNFLSSYVLSRNYGNYEGLFDAFSHGAWPNANAMFNGVETSWVNAKGLVPNDRTHVFKFSGSYNFPIGLSAGLAFIAQSGTPLSEYAGGETLGLKFLLPRGSAGRTPAIWDLNARIIYNINFISNWHSKLILDVFHIASQQKPVDIVQRKFYHPAELFPNSNYGQVYRYQPSMSVRLGMEVNF